jgi:hypothetical protein
MGHGPHSSRLVIVLFYVLFVFVLFYILFVCKCVLYYCHRVSTELQLTKYVISYILKTSHLGIELPMVAYVGDGLHIWKVATNILNKQSQTADKGRSSYLGV